MRSSGMNERGSTTRTRIIKEAQRQITENGVQATTAATVAAALNIPRPLFYHYFKNMDELAQQILDTLVASFLERVGTWIHNSETDSMNDTLDSAIQLWRAIHDETSLFQSSLAGEGNAWMYISFITETADKMAHFIVDELLSKPDSHIPPVNNPYETLFVLIVGVNELMRAQPNISDATLKQIVAHTLNVENRITSDEQAP